MSELLSAVDGKIWLCRIMKYPKRWITRISVNYERDFRSHPIQRLTIQVHVNNALDNDRASLLETNQYAHAKYKLITEYYRVN